MSPSKREAETDAELEAQLEEETSAASGVKRQPVSWKPQGDSTNLKWKRVKLDAPTVHVGPDADVGSRAEGTVPSQFPQRNCIAQVMYGTKRTLIEKVKKKLLDREAPWEKIPPQHAHL